MKKLSNKSILTRILLRRIVDLYNERNKIDGNNDR